MTCEMIIYLLILSLSSALLCQAGNVPVLLWSNVRIGETPLPSSLPAIPYSHFENFFFNTFSSKNVILFLQDELSIEDLSGNENSLKTIHKQIERHQSVYLPNVENPSFLINDLPDYGFKVNKVNANEVSGLIVNADSSNAIIVKLPPTTQSSSRKYPLQKTDETIKKVLSSLEKLKDVTVMLTGLRPVQSIEAAVLSEAKHSIKKRNVKQANKFFTTKCVLLYVSNDFYYMKDAKSYTLPLDKLNDVAAGECKKNISTIKITYGGVEELGEASVTFTFAEVRSTRWAISSAEVKSNLDATANKLIIPSWVPHMKMNESLVCGSPFTFVRVPIPSSGKTTEALRVKGLQVLAFTNGAKKFSKNNSTDCVGFFSIAIWAGLLVSFLAVMVLAWGFSMIISLKTMDHFDDPKAKPLVLNANE